MSSLLSMVAPHAVLTAITGATIYDKVGNMTTLDFSEFL